MRRLKNYFAFLGILTLLLTSCSREEPASDQPDTGDNMAILSLRPVLNSMMNKAALKQVMTLPECSDDVPAYCQMSLTCGDSDTPLEMTVKVLQDENGFFTAYDEGLAIPVPAGSTTVSVSLNDFMVRSDDGGSPGAVIWAAPKSGSEYADMVDQSLPISWNLRSGSKTYGDVPVMCFDNRQVNRYGYQLFDILQEQVVNLCFFANYCSDAGRHYTANYSLDLYLGDSDAGTPLYSDVEPETGMEGGFYADPVCMAVPAPGEGIGADEPYLYYEIRLLDWPGNYGTAGNHVETGTLSWNDVQALLNADGTTAEYEHIFINCGDEAPSGMDTHVLLAVDTENINEDNVNSHVWFIDDRMACCGDPTDPENYVSLVDQGMKIYWRGRPLDENSDATIDIVEFYRKPDGGPEILSGTYSDPNNEGVLVGQVRDEQVSGYELYSLEFTITEGDQVRTFNVDPKLNMGNTGN